MSASDLLREAEQAASSLGREALATWKTAHEAARGSHSIREAIGIANAAVESTRVIKRRCGQPDGGGFDLCDDCVEYDPGSCGCGAPILESHAATRLRRAKRR